ncbi:PIN domain-containing protein [Bernardetia sp. MNP-M8]|uniref:PIN domain-containing protein n=1 Tax=Bernardetia sp. MNP-M8 TaxID=3127470 RepID=UPI0030D5B73D
MIQVLVDTDILSYYLFKNYPVLTKNFNNYLNTVGYINIARPTIFEVESGLRAKNAFGKLEIFQGFITKHKILELTEHSTHLSAKIYATLRQTGLHSGVNDLYIAGIALENNLTICTNNLKDYENISNLQIVNWLE